MSPTQDQLLADAPVETRANLAPTTIEVASNLAEDTVIAGVMDIAAGVNKVAMFANPFAGGSEEMLYVDEQHTMRWARHVNSPVADQQLGEQPSGWTIEPVLSDVAEVVVAVHPTGSVFAWVLQGLTTSHLTSLELIADPAVLGGYRWAQGDVWLPDMNLSGLSVQYCTDRPSTPVVFVTDPGEPRLFWYLPSYAADPAALAWHPGGEFAYDPDDRNLRVVAGVDDPSEIYPQPSAVETVRLWTASAKGVWLTTYLPRRPQEPYRRERVAAGGNVSLVGAWTHPSGAGVVARVAAPSRMVLTMVPAPGGVEVQTLVLDQELEDLTVWQDTDTLIHLYGRSKGVLSAVHQLGWAQDPKAPFMFALPVWDSHPDQQSQSVLTTRPLVAKMATYAIDAYPDELPSQHVMHQDVPAGEACAIYTQSVRTNFWSTEKIRLVPETLPAPYTVPRYETSLTVKDAYGSPRAGVAVSLSADVPVDLEIDGRFFRTGAVTPLVLTTDFSGRITMRVVAGGLTVPALYATVTGMAKSVTVQMAADVHKFLSGDGSLPNHVDGFTPDTVTKANKADGTPLFPKLRKDHETGTWPPSADEVVTWCSAAFAVDAAGPLPSTMLAGLTEGQRVVGFTLQTHDPERPGFEVFTSADQVAGRREAITALGGFFDEADDWWGDVWQGIREGVNAVTEVFVDVANRAIEIAITLADGVMSVLRAAWDDIVSAAHAVEAAFVAIGAAIDDALQWLKWAFDLADVFATAKAMQSAFSEIGKQLPPVIEYYEGKAHSWFVSQEAEVKKLFADLKESVLPGRTVGGAQTPFAGTPNDVAVPATSGATGELGGPHASWLTDKLISPQNLTPGAAVPAKPTPVSEAAGALADELLDIITSAAAWPKLEAAWDDVGKLWTNLADAPDAQTAVAQELATLLDLLEHVVEAGLEFLDDVVLGLLEWLRRALVTLPDILGSPLPFPAPLLDVAWDFMVGSAGLDPDHNPLTWGSLGAVGAAFPTTLVYKMVTGHAPYGNGGLAGGGGAGGDAASEALDVHIVGGIAQLLETVWDTTFNVLCLKGPQARLTPARDFRWAQEGVKELCVPAWTVMDGCRTARLLGDAPSNNGRGFPPKSPLDEAAWISFLMDACWIVGGQIISYTYKSPLERFRTWEEDGKWNLGGVAITSLFGLAQMAFAMALWSPDNPNWFNVQRLLAQMLRRFPAATSFVRAINDALGTPTTMVAVGAKAVADGVFDLYAGSTTIGFAAHELGHPPVIEGAGVLTFGAGTAGQPYESDVVRVGGGLPDYRWEAVVGEGQTGLPEGLRVAYDASSDDGQTARVVGQADRPGSYTFTLHVKDGYQPPLENQKPCELTIYGKPEASFTVSPASGPAPLTAKFDDTSTGTPQTWAWDLGDGRKSDQQNPTIAYDKPGTYSVTLTVTNQAGTSTSAPQTVTVLA